MIYKYIIMCGIWQLFLNPINKSDINRYYKMCNKVSKRGPDMSNIINLNYGIIGFHRLAINGLTEDGMQPFNYETERYKYILVCNGEIYNHKDLEELCDYKNESKSDCEVLLPLLANYCNNNMELFFNMINGEFAMIITIIDKNTNIKHIYLSTDPMSVRPLFYQNINNKENSGLLVSSILNGMSRDNQSYRLKQAEIRYYIYDDNNINFINSNIYHKYENPEEDVIIEENIELYQLIVNTFFKTVEKRLMTDRPLCCLLSGGLDSSLVASVAQRIKKEKYPDKSLNTFTIGMEGGSDLEYAKQVADYIGSNHQEINFTPDIGLNVIDEVIKTCESYDITTIRASVGQYLLGKYISENTEYKVLLNGDGADEIEMGYLYFYLAPNESEAQLESIKLIKNICMFDGLRADRNISNFGLEARFPHEDKEFLDLYLKIDPKLKIPTKNRMEKYLIRKAFDEIFKDNPILPNEILWRKKEAFSDGVSNKEKSWYQMTQEYGKKMVSDEELIILQEKYKDYIMPTTNESAYYRKKFDEYFGYNAEKCIPYFWLPNWSNEIDPSARELKVY